MNVKNKNFLGKIQRQQKNSCLSLPGWNAFLIFLIIIITLINPMYGTYENIRIYISVICIKFRNVNILSGR